MVQVPLSKALLRDRSARARAGLPLRSRETASRVVAERLLTVPEVQTARVIAAFHPHGSEVAIQPALAHLLDRGVELLLPWVEGQQLQLSAVVDLGALRPGWRGVLEPDPGTRRPTKAGDVEVAIVPGLAFDLDGGRLGYGGGHIDRLLARLGSHVTVVAPAFAIQLVESVPREPHDEPVDVIVTEHAVHRLPPRP